MTAQPLLVVLLLALHANWAWGHGYMFEPLARNARYNSDYCPHCLAAGGPAVVSNGARFPNGRWGICGDPWNGVRKHEAGGVYARGEIVATYQEGQAVQVKMLISAFHKGRVQMRVCKINGLDIQAERSQLTEECLNANQLVQANVPGAQSPGDPYYHFGQSDSGVYCPQGVCLVQGTIHTAWFKLPAGLTCDGVSSKCVIQWWWLTGNSCEPPGEGAPWTPRYMDDCGSGGTPYPEEFWNCADIRILPSGVPLPPDPSPQPSPSPIPNPPITTSPPIVNPPSPNPHMPSGPSGCSSGDAACYCKWLNRDGFYPDIDSGCRRYYMCSQGLSFYERCPTDFLIYNPEIMACDYPEHSTCPSDPDTDPNPTPSPSPSPSPPSPPASSPPASPPPSNPPPSTPPPSSPPPSTPPPNTVPPTPADCGPRNARCFCAGRPIGTYPSVKIRCRGFFLCGSGAQRFVNCPSGTRYSMATNQCEWAAGVRCPAAGSALKKQALQPRLKIAAGMVVPHAVRRPWRPNKKSAAQK